MVSLQQHGFLVIFMFWSLVFD